MSVLTLARPDIVDFKAYVTAEQKRGTLRLNANELPYSPPQTSGELNRYPRIRPDRLEARLAEVYGVPPANILVTRGSSEAIDILIRTFCRAYTDNIVTTPPTFAMYKVYADMQAASERQAPLSGDGDFAFDNRTIINTCNDNSKLIFLCSPNNPTGNSISRDQVLSLAHDRRGKSLIVVDEAYVEFSEQNSLADDACQQENLVVLRTLSKASGLAAARCGSIIASADSIALLRKMLPPYAFAAPTTECLLAALDAAALKVARQQVATIVAERARVTEALLPLKTVEKIWPSDANFILVRFSGLPKVAATLDAANILVRLYDNNPLLSGCARITIGSPDENDALLAALESLS